MFGAVMHGLDGTFTEAESTDAYAEVKSWTEARGWHVDATAPALQRLAHLIETLRKFDFPLDAHYFDAAADTAELSARAEVEYARRRPDRTSAVEAMTIGTVIIEQALVQVRRIALEAVSFQLDSESRNAGRAIEE